MPSWLMGFVTDVFRSVLWFIAEVCLKLCDYIFSILTLFYKLKLSQFTWIWNVYWVIAGALGLFVLFRIAVIIMRSYFSDDTMEKLSGASLFWRVMMVGLITTLIPVLLPLLSNATAAAADYIYPEDSYPSDILIESGNTDFTESLGSTETIRLDEGQHAIDVITLTTINSKEDDKYVYIPQTENLLLIIVLGGMCCYVFISVAIQIISRLIGLLMKILIAPVSVSGIVDPNDNSTSVWFKLCMSDFITAFFQLMLIWVVMYFTAHLPSGFNGFSKGLIFIAAIMTILVAPGGIAQLIGGDVGGQSGMQMLGQMHALKDSISSGFRLAKTATVAGAATAGVAASMAVKGGSGALYGLGRLAGARTLNAKKELHGKGSTPISFGGSGNGKVGEDSAVYMAKGSEGQNNLGYRVGTDGIRHYQDGKVTNFNSDATEFVFGHMANVMAGRIYQKAGARWLTSKKDRQMLGEVRQRKAMNDMMNSTSNKMSGIPRQNGFNQQMMNSTSNKMSGIPRQNGFNQQMMNMSSRSRADGDMDSYLNSKNNFDEMEEMNRRKGSRLQ